jgi:hypothetical protein
LHVKEQEEEKGKTRGIRGRRTGDREGRTQTPKI